jgi:ParB family chromosome partitioning protein
VPSKTAKRPSLADFEVAAAAVPPVDDRLVHSLPTTEIVPSPRNPRQLIDGIAELADSLREHGLLQPVVVRRRDAGYELIAGHRRFEAARVLGWTEIAAVVRDETDDQAYILTLVENLQREDLTPKEEAAALEVLIRERGWSTRQVGEAIKRGPMYVSRRLRVFDDDTLAPLVLANKLPVSTAEEFLVVADAAQRSKLAQQAADERWERPQVRAAVNDCIAAIQPLSAEQRSRRLVKLIEQIRDVLSAGPVDELSDHALSAAALLRAEMTAIGRRRRSRSSHL